MNAPVIDWYDPVLTPVSAQNFATNFVEIVILEYLFRFLLFFCQMEPIKMKEMAVSSKLISSDFFGNKGLL